MRSDPTTARGFWKGTNNGSFNDAAWSWHGRFVRGDECIWHKSVTVNSLQCCSYMWTRVTWSLITRRVRLLRQGRFKKGFGQNSMVRLWSQAACADSHQMCFMRKAVQLRALPWEVQHISTSKNRHHNTREPHSYPIIIQYEGSFILKGPSAPSTSSISSLLFKLNSSIRCLTN